MSLTIAKKQALVESLYRGLESLHAEYRTETIIDKSTTVLKDLKPALIIGAGEGNLTFELTGRDETINCNVVEKVFADPSDLD